MRLDRLKFSHNDYSKVIVVQPVERCPLKSNQSVCRLKIYKIFGGYGGGVTPVPIPNTEVKPSIVDGTAPEREWESRTPPDLNLKAPRLSGGLFLYLFFVGRNPEGEPKANRGFRQYSSYSFNPSYIFPRLNHHLS